ncbi:MAG: tRNA lysidine(34) synthetase TilS [Candidatus Firestonebacteria bacterium]
MLNKAKETIEKYRMLDVGDKVAIAVSGGPDSLALLFILHQLADEFNLKLTVLHLNHKLRGKESDDDETYVKKICKKLKIQCSAKTVDVLEYAVATKLSIEDASRKIRYEFFERESKKIKADKLALGHNFDDQAETVLMRILRGAGLDGLTGIPPVRKLSSVLIIRPLIECPRKEIEVFLKSHNLTWRQDSSNLKDIYFRNKIRLKLLSLIEKEYSPAIKKNLVQLSEIARQDIDFLKGEAKKIFKKLAIFKEGKVLFEIKKFTVMHLSLQRLLLREAIISVCGNLLGITYEHLEQILESVRTKKTINIELPHQVYAKIRYGNIEIGLKKDILKKEAFFCQIEIPGEFYIPEIDKTIFTSFKNIKYLKLKTKNKKKILVDADKIDLPLVLRNRLNGDRFYPFGMNFSKKLKIFLIDEKIPFEYRDKIPILVDNRGKIIWVIGLRMDNRFKVTRYTQNALEISIY